MKSFFESKTSEYDWLISSFFGCHVSFRGCKCRLQLERQQGSYIWVFFPCNWKGRDEKIDIMMRWKWSYLLKYVLKVLYRPSMVASNSNIISLSMTLNAPNETCSKPEPLSWWTTITNEWKAWTSNAARHFEWADCSQHLPAIRDAAIMGRETPPQWFVTRYLLSEL